MNSLEPRGASPREAKIKYLDADFQVIREGDFVPCAVTGSPISLNNLRYWDVSRQVAFASAAAAFSDRLKLGGS